jgi:hypothetical protein
MNTAYVVRGRLKEHKLIELEESLPFENGIITVMVSKQGGNISRKRFAGKWKGQIELAPDFDEPLEDFREYME